MHKIPVKIERIEKQQKSNGIIHAIAGLYLLATAVTSAGTLKTAFYLLFPVVFTGLFSVVYSFFKNRFSDHRSWNRNLRIAQAACFFALSFVFLRSGNNWNAFGLFAWGLISIFLFWGERNLYSETNISLEERGIVIPGSPANHLLPWNMVERFVARPDFVTISRHDNKFVQLELSKSVDKTTLDNANKFSRDHIALAIPNKK
jgi:hypothetical protein